MFRTLSVKLENLRNLLCSNFSLFKTKNSSQAKCVKLQFLALNPAKIPKKKHLMLVSYHLKLPPPALLKHANGGTLFVGRMLLVSLGHRCGFGLRPADTTDSSRNSSKVGTVGTTYSLDRSPPPPRNGGNLYRFVGNALPKYPP